MYVSSSARKGVLVWLYTGLVMVFCMIAIGGITRLTESGLSITEWNVVMGSVPPLNEEKWMEEFEKYKQSPEFRHKNFDFTLQQFKSIYWWEFIHRLWGRLIGLVFFVPFMYFLLRSKIRQKGFWRLLTIFILGGLQGFIGWYMVQSGLVNEPRVSHYRLALHLVTALLTMALIWWLILDIRMENKKEAHPGPRKLNPLLWTIWAVFIIQIIYGAFVAGKDAGQYFNTWPTMDGHWVPPYLLGNDSLENKLLEEIPGIQFIHRTVAIILFLLIAVLWWMSKKQTLTIFQRQGVSLTFSAIGIQFILGVCTILLAVPVWLGVLHQLGAVLLMLSLLFLTHRWKK